MPEPPDLDPEPEPDHLDDTLDMYFDAVPPPVVHCHRATLGGWAGQVSPRPSDSLAVKTGRA